MDIDLEALAANGYTVVRKLVPEPLCDALVAAITQTSGLDPGDPETWHPDPPLPWNVAPLWGHQVQRNVRQHAPLHKVWAEVWGTDRLTVTLDRCRFTPPWREGRPVELPIHWDHNPHDPKLRYIQGVVALSDTPVGAGGFRCVPSLYRDRAAWPVDPVIDEGEACWYPSTTGYEIVNVPVRRGDVIIWESRLPHANSRNLSAYPRLAFYISFYPASVEERQVTADCTRLGLCHPAWRGWTGHGHREKWAPPQLTELGRQIAGLAEWL